MKLLAAVTMIAMTLVVGSVTAIEKLACMAQQFSQRQLGYGNLERKAGNQGRLSFKVDPSEVLHLLFRIHPRIVDSPSYDPYDVPSASSLSLARTLDALGEQQRNRTTMTVFLNSREEAEYSALKNWTVGLFQDRCLFVLVYSCPPGNTPSYNCMVETLFQHKEAGIVQDDDIIYFVEDDYLHHPEATRQLVDIYSSHNPCFAVPYDYADRYYMDNFNDDDGKITIVAGRERHWRTIVSTTVTFSARFATLNYFFGLDMVPHPKDDYFASLALANFGASILSPIPSLAAHIESYGEYMSRPDWAFDSHEYVSLYHDWFAEADSLLTSARKMKWNLWSLVKYYRSHPSTEVLSEF